MARTVRPGISRRAMSSTATSQISTLGNGLRVATERIESNSDTATVGVWIDTGSRYENADNNGVAHFAEHMFFKGTKNRSMQQITQEIENMGGHLNAYTSREQTVFYVKVLQKDVPQAVDILSDMLQNSKFDPAQIEQERSTILREMQEVEGQMEEVVFDMLHKTAYRDSSMAYTILGPEENINKISQKDIKDYVDTHYVAPRMCLAVAGDVDHASMVKLADAKFGNVPQKSPNGVDAVLEPARYTGSSMVYRQDDMDLLHVAYGFPTAGWNDPDNYPLMVIDCMLGSWDENVSGGEHSSSVLVSNIAEQDLATSVQCFNTQYSDTGLFGVYATAHDVRSNETMWNITNELTRLCYEVEEAKLEQAKNCLRYKMLSQLDGSTAICEDLGRQVLTHGRRISPEEVMARINAVDVNAVKACANRYFYDRDPVYAAIGPSYELPDYNWCRRRTYFLRF